MNKVIAIVLSLALPAIAVDVAYHMSDLTWTGTGLDRVATWQVGQQDVLNGLVAWWKMDEATWSGASDDVVDSSGNGNNGTSSGGIQPTIGNIGNAGLFDGSDDYINVGNKSTLLSALNGTFSITYWAFGGGYSTNQVIFGIKDADYSRLIGYNIWVPGQVSVVEEGTAVIISVEPTLNVWQFWVWSYDGSILRVYVDGIFLSGATYSFHGNYTGIYNIGSSTSSFNGLLDDFRVYNRALSSNEVNTIYQMYK